MKVDGAEVERRVAAFTAAARQAGVKLTQQRLEIFREVAGRADHPNAEAVFQAIQPRLPTVSRDTVYRTLGLLHDLGMITTLGPRRESVHFDANLAPHHHFVCLRCGLAQDFTSAELDAVEVPAPVRALGRAVTVLVEVRGICRRCARRGTNGG